MLSPVEGQEPITVALTDWTIHLQQGRPSLLGAYRDHATLVGDFHLADGDAGVCFVAVSRASADWPELVVLLPQPAGYGFNPAWPSCRTRRCCSSGPVPGCWRTPWRAPRRGCGKTSGCPPAWTTCARTRGLAAAGSGEWAGPLPEERARPRAAGRRPRTRAGDGRERGGPVT
jgi:hypothetical protein